MESRKYDEVFTRVASGESITTACRNARVHKPQFYVELRRDRAMVERYANAVHAQVLTRFTQKG